MANNRLWLVHVPTGKRVFLGKRMGSGWYGTPDDLGAKVLALFEATEENDEDNFALAIEDGREAPYAHGEGWKYSGDDNRIIFDEEAKK